MPRPANLIHGTLTAYTNHGCRCSICARVMAVYQRNRPVTVKDEKPLTPMRPCLRCGKKVKDHSAAEVFGGCQR